MPTGIKVPFSVGPTGGIALAEKERQNNTIIKIALTDGSNENAFQQNITLGESIIFDINDPVTRTAITAKVRAIFEQFKVENRFKLMVETMVWDDDAPDGEAHLRFRYLDLESDETYTFDQALGAQTPR